MYIYICVCVCVCVCVLTLVSLMCFLKIDFLRSVFASHSLGKKKLILSFNSLILHYLCINVEFKILNFPKTHPSN